MNRAKKTARRRIVALTMAIAAGGVSFGWTGAARATTSTWIAGSSDWYNANNWSPFGVPGSDDNVQIVNETAINRTITYDYTGSALTLNELAVDDFASGTDTLSMSGNALSANYESIGFDDDGWRCLKYTACLNKESSAF